jgi:hypothetical protein
MLSISASSDIDHRRVIEFCLRHNIVIRKDDNPGLIVEADMSEDQAYEMGEEMDFEQPFSTERVD